MNVQEIIQFADTLYHDLTYASAREWQEERGGAKAIGAMPIYVPREIIHAAGMLPVGLMGGGNQVEIIRGDAYFQSYICQIPRSTIELALTGKYDFLSGFLFPSICDVIRNLSGMWKVLFKDKYVRYVDLPQNYDREVGGRFWHREMSELAKDLGELSGQKVTPERLRASIALYNENRRAIGRLMSLRHEEPWRVPAHESYLILRAGNVLPVEEHTRLVGDYCAAAIDADRPMRDNTRIVTVGSFCEQPPLELIKTLEMAGCYIVWDDTLLGQYWFEGDIPTDGDPLQALTTAFLEKSASTSARYEPDAEKGASIRKICARTKAEGVIFAAPSFCDPALLEQPMLQDAMDAAGIPWTAFKYAENLGQFQVIREQAGTFADSVKLWSEG
ncbi:MAG: benzoyl-CoA reductase subunit C [Deltaproteobacteria bacterium]|nr:benzoyl-CoA reductase subunit C [Deltaproteobacteria bacterium]